MNRHLLLLAAGALMLGACKEDPPTALDLNGPPTSLALVSGNNQEGEANAPLSAPLVVFLSDDQGRPVPAFEIRWLPSAGTVSSTIDSTGDDGQASVFWTMPSMPGEYTLTALLSGVGSVVFSAKATPPGGNLVFRFLDAGAFHTCGLVNSEHTVCWGYNGDGQVTRTPSEPVAFPTAIEGFERFRQVSGGRYHTCGLTLSGGVTCWGVERDSRIIPGDPVSYQAVSAGLLHTCALSQSRQVWCWGFNGEGQVGVGPAVPVPGQVIPAPLFVGGGFKAVAAGGLHACGIQENGLARCWGFGAEGQLGDGLATTSGLPVTVIGPSPFRVDPAVAPPEPNPDFPLPPGPFIAAGYAHTCAIGVNGTTYCWGLNENGQLGDGTTTNRLSPASVAGQQFVRITAGKSHTCGLTAAGAGFCWGDNTHGQLGDGTQNDRTTPVQISGGLAWAWLRAGDLSTCGVTTTGVAYCWGDNEYRQLGAGTTVDRSLEPVKVAFQP